MEWFVYIALVLVFVALRLSLRFATGGLRWSGGDSNVEDEHARALVQRASHVPTRRAADAPEAAVVRLVGEVKVHEDAVTAPISGARCAHWRVVLYQNHGVGLSQSWEHLAQHTEHASFVLADSSGEVLVDPAHATVSVGRLECRILNPSEALPQQVAALLVERGWSIEDLRRRDRSVRVDETTLGFGTSVAVVGAGTTVSRRGDRSEHDYRTTSPTWLAFGGREVDLLISDARPLLRRAQGVAGAAEEWARSGRDESQPVETSGGTVDVFEARLRRRARVVRLLTMVVFGIAAVKIAFALGIERLWTKAPPATEAVPLLTEAQRASLRDEIDRRRVVTYRGDDDWRRALQAREQLAGKSPDFCPQTAILDQQLARSFKNSFSASNPDARFPLVAIEAGAALPVTSPRTDGVVAALDKAERSIATAHATAYESLRAQVLAPPVTTVDVLVELARDADRVLVRAWAYDHQASRIVCAGEHAVAAAELNTGTAGFVSGILDSLRAVSSDQVVQP